MQKKWSEGDKWFTMPRELIKRHGKSFGAACIAVYTILAAYANEKNLCRLNYKQLHTKLGITHAETVRCLHKLEDLHLIRSSGKGCQLMWVPDWGKRGEKGGDKYGCKQSSLIDDNRINIIIDIIISTISRAIKSNHKIIQTLMENTNEHNEYEDSGIEYSTDPTELAYELAEVLDDTEAIQMYLSYVHQYPESVLREKLTRVLSVPEEKIRKTRGALFNYLMQQYGKNKKKMRDSQDEAGDTSASL